MDLKELEQMLEMFESTDSRNFFVKKGFKLIAKFFHTHKSKVSQSEQEDLLMDIITVAYEVCSTDDEMSYNTYCSKLYFKLLDWEKSILTRYHGVKISRRDVRKAKLMNEPIRLTKVCFSELDKEVM